MKTLIKNANVVNPAGKSGLLDILIEDALITRMDENITEAADTVIYSAACDSCRESS